MSWWSILLACSVFLAMAWSLGRLADALGVIDDAYEDAERQVCGAGQSQVSDVQGALSTSSVHRPRKFRERHHQ